MRVNRQQTTPALVALLALISLLCSSSQAPAQTPSWLNSAVIYCIDQEIFSTSGLSGVIAQLPRLKSLGVNVLWLMPIYPRGQACTVDGISHPSYNSPYDINNMEAIDPNAGTSAQLTTLISTAHSDGMKVILDVALNCTSWDNPLITSNPQYYLHSDGNVNNVASIEDGWGSDQDIAQFDLSQNTYGAQTYVTNVMTYWENAYGFDGFRFDSADDPSGPSRSFPQSLAESIATALKNINPNVLLLGEEFDQIQLALAPYGLDYDVFNFQNAVQQACASGNSAAALESSWSNSFSGWPSGMMHMAVMQDWDLNADLSMYGGTSQTMDAAVTNFTIGSYVPEIFNGEEVANTAGGDNTHNQIIWNGSNATAFTNFYTSLIALKANHASLLSNSTMTWESNSDTSAVATYDRSNSTGDEVFVEVNFSGSAQSGTVTVPSGNAWIDVSPSGSPGGASHELPSTGDFSLAAYDFAVFERSTTPQAPPAPTGLAPIVGNGQVTLTWNASSGATSYNVYRGTSSGGEGTTAIASGLTSTSYTNNGLTNGTTYYYEVAAVNSVGTSVMSGQVSATPSSVAGSLSGTLTSVSTAQAFNLTTLGTSDWAAWGFDGMDHDASGGSKIGNAGVYGAGSLTSFNSSFLGFSWTNGAPDAGETDETYGYYNNTGVGDGFQFTVPAGTSSQTLYVYVGGWSSGGTLTATLSDGSAASYSNSGLSNAGNSYYGCYALTFNSASAGQTLTVVWKEASGSGNVTLYAAALSGGSTPTAATPTFSPAPGSYNGTQLVTISDTTSGATIYYTTNGTNPTTSSSVYSGAVNVSSTETIEAIAAASGYSNSSVASGTYTITQPPAAPTGLTATAGNAQVTLTWTAGAGAVSYNVYRGTSSGGEGATPIVTGITSTTYTNTGLTNGTAYYYKVASVNTAGTSGMSGEQSATPTGASGGSLTGSPTTVTSAQAFNLTTQGTSDWAAWGFNGTDRDTSGGSQIGALAVYGAGTLNSFTSSFFGFTWTNGTPDAGETDETKGYYNNAGVGDGFSFTVPAGTTSQTVVVYVGGWSTGGTLTATLSDGSASAYTDSSMSNSSNSYYGYYTLTYKAASSGQTLTLVWKQASGSGNVTVYAAALEGQSLPTAATPTFSPSPGSYNGTQSVTISDTTSGATIYFTTNGATPTTSSSVYSSAISVSSSETIEAMAAASGYNNSSVVSGAYAITQIPAAPTGLTATAGNTQVALSWTASSGATSYNVYRATSSGGEGATPIITGISSTSYTNTGLTNGTMYYYKVAAVNTAGTSGMSGEQSATPTASGSLTGSPTVVSSAQAFNLTSQGTTDWAAWGFDGTDRDTSGGSKIGALAVSGSGALNSFTSSYLGFTWTNGTPDTSETNETKGYYNNAGVGDGFTFIVPASTTSQNLTVYVGGWSSGGTLTASLSDGSAPNYTDSSMSNSSNSYYGYYTLTYKAASANQTLTVTWKQASGSGNVTIYAAALH